MTITLFFSKNLKNNALINKLYKFSLLYYNTIYLQKKQEILRKFLKSYYFFIILSQLAVIF